MSDEPAPTEINPETYEEFALLRDNADEAGLPWNGSPAVRREFVDLPDGRRLGAIVWGDEPAEAVLLHGGAQNAHTWDTVALALNRPLVAIDLPGHGHSDWRDDGGYSLTANADDVATAIRELAPQARTVVGMSFGGLTAIALMARHAHLVPRLVLVDVTPGVNHEKAEAIVTFITGPETFESFDSILAYTIEHNATRTARSLRRGVLHNARARADGVWIWRYDRNFAGDMDGLPALWDHLEASSAPLLLARGGESPVVDDDDVEELRRRRPDALIEVVDGAGHSIQGDRPVELATVLARFLDG